MQRYCHGCGKEPSGNYRFMVGGIEKCNCGELLNYSYYRCGQVQISLKRIEVRDHKHIYSYSVSIWARSLLRVGDNFQVPSNNTELDTVSNLLLFIMESSDLQDKIKEYSNSTYDGKTYIFNSEKEEVAV